MGKRLLGVAVILLIPLGPMLHTAAQFPIAIPLFSSEPEIAIEAGSTIPVDALDGVIGTEWDDAESVEMRMGKYRATVYQKRDGTYLYVAMVIRTARRFIRGFEGYVVFENGDGREYSRGDDMLLVEANQGELVDADYYYVDTYDYRLDTRSAGRRSADGAGRFDASEGTYIFEFRKELMSGDARDAQLCTGCDFILIYGWASY